MTGGVRVTRRASLILYGIATVLAIVWLVPVLSAFMISMIPLSQTRTGWWEAGLTDFTFNNYVRAWDEGLSSYVVNSFIITLGSVALSILIGSAAAYAFSRLRFRFKETMYFLLITTMIVPVQIILVPLLPWFRTLNLTGDVTQYVGIVLVHVAFGAGWAIFMLGGFMAEVPEEILEAARMDGANHLKVYRHLMMPLALPGIASFALIDFVFVWNDLLLGLTLLDREHQPLTVGLANLQAPHLSQEDLVSAGSIMAILPPLLLFALLNRYYVRGLFAGGVKG
jgi:ABC-type glycerol-3-phosphate transport system permease component